MITRWYFPSRMALEIKCRKLDSWQMPLLKKGFGDKGNN